MFKLVETVKAPSLASREERGRRLMQIWVRLLLLDKARRSEQPPARGRQSRHLISSSCDPPMLPKKLVYFRVSSSPKRAREAAGVESDPKKSSCVTVEPILILLSETLLNTAGRFTRHNASSRSLASVTSRVDPHMKLSARTNFPPKSRLAVTPGARVENTSALPWLRLDSVRNWSGCVWLHSSPITSCMISW